MRYLTSISILAAVMFAQTPSNRDATPGFWADWTWDAKSDLSHQDAASPAEFRLLGAKVRELREVLKSAPAVSQPIGFDAMLAGHVRSFTSNRSDLKAKDFPLGAGILFGAFAQYFDRNGNLTRELGETELIDFRVNVLPFGETPEDWQDRNGTTDIFLQPKQLPDIVGLPHFQNVGGRFNDDFLVLKKNPKPIWAPVSTEEMLNLLAALRKRAIAEREREAAQHRKSLADWIDPQKRAARMETAKKYIAPHQKDPAAYLVQAEEQDRKFEEQMRKTVENDNPEHNQWWAKDVAGLGDIERALANLSAERKSAQACYRDREGRVVVAGSLARIVPTNTPGCQPIVRPNWDYFDRRLPRTSFQLMTISTGVSRAGGGAQLSACLERLRAKPTMSRPGCRTNIDFLNSIDWNNVLALFDK